MPAGCPKDNGLRDILIATYGFLKHTMILFKSIALAHFAADITVNIAGL